MLCVCSDDDNRIILRPLEGHPDCQGDFINASFIDVRATYFSFLTTLCSIILSIEYVYNNFVHVGLQC